MREAGAPVQWRTVALTVGAVAGVVVLGGAFVALDVWLHPEESSPLGVLDDGAEVQRVDRRRWLTGEETELRVVLQGETLGSAPLELPGIVSASGDLVVWQDEATVVFRDRTLREVARITPPPDESFYQLDWPPGLFVSRSRAEETEADDRLRVYALPAVVLAFETTVPRAGRHVFLDERLVIVTDAAADLVTRVGLERLTPEGAARVEVVDGTPSWTLGDQTFAALVGGPPISLSDALAPLGVELAAACPGEPPTFVATATGGEHGPDVAYVAVVDAQTGARRGLFVVEPVPGSGRALETLNAMVGRRLLGEELCSLPGVAGGPADPPAGLRAVDAIEPPRPAIPE